MKASIGLHASTHKSGGTDAIKLDELAAPTDISTLNASTSAHGLLKKLDNNVNHFLDGQGNYNLIPDAALSSNIVTLTGNQVLTTKTIDIKDNILANRNYSSIVFKSGSTYYAKKFDGTLISSGSVPETVIQAALNLGGYILIAGTSGSSAVSPTPSVDYTFSGAFAGLDFVTDGTTLEIQQGANLVAPSGHPSYVIRMLDTYYDQITGFGNMYEAGTPQRLWTGIRVESNAGGSAVNTVENINISGPGTALELKTNNSSAFIEGCIFRNITVDLFVKGVVFNGAVGGEIHHNSFADINLENNLSTPFATDGFKDIDFEGNIFVNCNAWDFTAGASECNIKSTATATTIIGGQMTGRLGTFTDLGVGTIILDFKKGAKFDSGKLSISNPAKTFNTILVNSAITANRNLTIPLLTGDDTMAVLNLAQTFLQPITIKKDVSVLETLFRDTNVVTNDVGLNYNAKNSVDTQKTYINAYSYLLNTTSGSEEGAYGIDALVAGVTKTLLWLQAGTLIFGPLQRANLKEAGLTASRDFTFPDVTTKLAGVAFSNIFSVSQQFDDFVDRKVITAPASPASGYNRIYSKAVDANNDGLFVKEKVNGAVVEVQYA